MLKRFLFAVAPMVLVASSVMADDSLLTAVAKMDLADTQDKVAQADPSEDLGLADVESLLNDGEEASSEDAIAACFRRIGFGGYRSYGYNHCSYNSWYSPCYSSYSYSYCQPVTYSYTPCYTYYTPCYTSYWGCW